MIIKTNYKNKLSNLKQIINQYENTNDIIASIDNLISTIDNYKFRIVMIGGFSSGKSAFLNKLIGRDLFKENQLAETAIPAEISWGGGR